MGPDGVVRSARSAPARDSAVRCMRLQQAAGEFIGTDNAAARSAKIFKIRALEEVSSALPC